MAIIFVWIITFEYFISSQAFLENCKWTNKDNEVNVNCSKRGLRFIPKFNDSVTNLDLSHNEIAVITSNSLPKRLKHFDISWNSIKHLKTASFGFLPNLEYIDLSYCNIRDVDEGVFGELVNLRYLNISYNRELGFASLPNITFDINKTSIMSLDFNGINCATGVGTMMKRYHLKFIQTTNLSELFLANNRLELFEPGVIHRLPKSIKILSIAENRLTAGVYLLEFENMSGLKILNISYLIHPPLYPYSVIDQCIEKADVGRKGIVYQQTSTPFHFNWSMLFPKKLETLYAQSSRLYIVDPRFSVIAPNLRHVYLQNNFILSLKGKIRTEDSKVETIDISNNFCSHLFRSIDGKNVRHMNISHNYLSQDLERDTNGSIFKMLTNLSVLDMSFNKILSLPKLLLKNQNKLEYLNASNNRLSEWFVDVKHMSNLTLLDLSDNKFATISQSARNQLEKLFHINLAIDLSRNGLACTCENQSGQELMFVLEEVIPRLEVNKSLKLIVRDRDYLPGIPKVDSIMNGLQESKRTICIVSKKYLESKWRDYELNMAKVEAIEDRGSLDYVILILLPDVYNDEIPHKIMDLIKKDRFIEYPMESCAYDDFWERLMVMLDQ